MQNINIEIYKSDNVIVNDAYDRFISMIPVMKRTKGYSLFTISGCEPGAGATAISIHVALAMAGSGWKVLLVDSDMRKEQSAKKLSRDIPLGLSDCLLGNAGYEEIVCSTNIENLDFISCGKRESNPVRLLNGSRFDDFTRWANEKYDYAVFDSPSLNTTIDAGIIASKTSGIILVAGYMGTKTSSIHSARQEILKMGANLIGIVLNHVPRQGYKKFVKDYDYFIKRKFIKNKKGKDEKTESRNKEMER